MYTYIDICISKYVYIYRYIHITSHASPPNKLHCTWCLQRNKQNITLYVSIYTDIICVVQLISTYSNDKLKQNETLTLYVATNTYMICAMMICAAHLDIFQ